MFLDLDMRCTVNTDRIENLKRHLSECVTVHSKPRNPTMINPLKRRLTFNLWPGNFSEEFVTTGLYFTGNGDILACFCCNYTMGNWDDEDDPLERHLNEHPECMFIFDLCEVISLCPFCKKMVPQARKLPGRSIKEHAERCLETAIATKNELGKFPRNVRMGNVSNRLKSFKKWPKNDTSIQDFVNSGFYYTGHGDVVTCFYCSITIKNWSTLDNVFEKHADKSPSCLFVHNFLNIVRNLELVDYEDMKMESNRLKTFSKWSFDTDPKELAKTGFFYIKRDDLVECAFCKVIISSKEFCVSEQPLITHARKSPVCPLIQSTTLILKPLYPEMVNPLNRLHTFHNYSGKNSLDYVKSGFYGTDHFAKCFWCGFETKICTQNIFKIHAEKRPECIFAQNACFQEINQISEKKDYSNEDVLLCTICCANERDIVFQNCGHLMCCQSCASRFEKCPGCRKPISKTLRIYIS